MKEIFIKYNPYKLETKVLIDGKAVKPNSELNIGEKRLQEWIEKLPEILVNECNTKNLKIKFHGNLLDYEDLISVVNNAKNKDINIECSHVPAKKTEDKEKAIEMIFRDIQKGPFEELKQADLKKAFEMAKSSDFEVNVIATMSAGKSTLINALLRQKLMPAKQEACTATITKIKDKDDLENFRAMGYDKNGELIETQPELTFRAMEGLNSNPEVSHIDVQGNIPFVTSEEISLVLVDTPGPNNSRDLEHKRATYRMISESSKALVIYILNATQLAVNDDNELLDDVAKSMSVGGKQSKDRFIFVVNKLDEFKKGEDSVSDSIEKVRKYLNDKGIENPNIYPATALAALDIRTALDGVDISKINLYDDDISEDIESAIAKVRRLNRNEELHLNDYAPLTSSERGKIESELAIAKENDDKCAKALIYSGIPSIEAAIKLYVDKYAKTAKIKNIVDTFLKKLESTEIFEKTKNDIASNESKAKKIKEQIDSIQKKLKSGAEAKEFKQKIDAINYDTEIQGSIKRVLLEMQGKISYQIGDSKIELTIKEAHSLCQSFDKFFENLQANFQVKLEEIIEEHLIKNAQKLLDEYKEKIKDLVQGVDKEGISLDPFKLLEGDIRSSVNIENLVSGISKVKKVKIDEKWIENTDKKWYKPWTWWEEEGHYEDVYEDKEYVKRYELAQRFFAPVQKRLFEDGDAIEKYGKEQTLVIKEAFKDKFIELDKILSEKLSELESYTNNTKDIEKDIKENAARLEWLEGIKSRIQGILDI